MAILAIDTAGPDCAVAIARPVGAVLQVLSQETARIGRGHSDVLIPMLGRALQAARLDYPDIERIGVTVGPGSFTGIRAGIAAARGLALALNIPAVGVGVQDGLAESAAAVTPIGLVVAVLDARRGEVFAYAIDAASRAVLLPATAGEPDGLATRIAALAGDGPLTLTGSGAAMLRDALVAVGKIAAIHDHAESADIATVAAITFRAHPGQAPVPLYLRGADAKVQSGKAVARR